MDLTVNGAEIIDVEENEEFMEKEDETIKRTYSNPSQIYQPSSREDFKCGMCDFASARKSDLIDHRISSHNWCNICFSSFVFQESLQNHIKKMHSDQGSCLVLNSEKLLDKTL